MLKIIPEVIHNSYCQLGEGIFISGHAVYWVDILSKSIWRASSVLQNKKLNDTPSVIFEGNNDQVFVGTDVSLELYSKNFERVKTIVWDGLVHDKFFFRSNDGANFLSKKLIGFMHRDCPELNPGYIYLENNGALKLIDNTIFIPNSFIVLGKDKVLISDSLKSEVWCFNFDSEGNFLSKKLWARLEKSIAPDGGCLIDNMVFLALWDGSSIAVFDLDGNEMQRLALPVPKPTNCKYDKKNKKLWVTSARCGMSQSSLKKFPDSGNTFCFYLDGV